MATNRSRNRRRRHSATKKTRNSSSRERAVRDVHADMLRNPRLTYSRALHKHGVDPRWAQRHFGHLFFKDSSGRIRAQRSSRRTKTLHIPTDTPGVSVPVVTRNERERLLIGEWMAALNEARNGRFARIKRFSKDQVVGGVRLATDPDEVQRILEAMAEEDTPFEGLYRSIARPS